MKAFWWFEDQQVAGMARPGFNDCRWFDFPYDEAVVMGWLGQHSTRLIPLDAFRRHVQSYAPKVAPFYALGAEQVHAFTRAIEDLEILKAIVEGIASRTRFIGKAKFRDDHLQLEICKHQLGSEMKHLKSQGIGQIVSLTEDHHLDGEFGEEFELSHISIRDMEAPTLEQARELACILDKAESGGKRIAVHCLAGIGRTSTMLIAAELLRGKTLPDLLRRISERNPSFRFVGSQARFVQSVAAGHADP